MLKIPSNPLDWESLAPDQDDEHQVNSPIGSQFDQKLDTEPKASAHLLLPENGGNLSPKYTPQVKKSKFYYGANDAEAPKHSDQINPIITRVKRNSAKKPTLLYRTPDEGGMKDYYKQLRPKVSRQILKSEDNAPPLLRQLTKAMSHLIHEERHEKAARHFEDAIYLRAVRHDIDDTKSKFLKAVYFLQTNYIWQCFLHLVSWVYMAVGFFEPPHANAKGYFQDNPDHWIIILAIEAPVLLIFLMELFMEIYHRANDKRPFKASSLKNKKVLCKIILDVLFLVDFIIFFSNLPNPSFRFSRALRPCTDHNYHFFLTILVALALYSKQLRRTLFGIIRALRDTLDIFFLFLFITCLFALIGVRIIGDLNGEIPYDPYLSNFKEFGPALNSLYIMLSFDNYPDIMFPSLQSSYLYLFYFVPYVTINLLLLIPIPIAVIFDGFRKDRSRLVVKDRLKEREAIIACFLLLDIHEYFIIENQRWNLYRDKAIGREEFMALCRALYKKRLNMPKAYEIFELANKEENGKITLEAFFEVAEIMGASKDLTKSTFNIRCWDSFREKVNRILKLDKIVVNMKFQLIMSMIILLNIILLIADTFINDDHVSSILDTIDMVLVSIYLVEVIIKILGLGIVNYFSDPWNMVDFVVTMVAFSGNVAVIVIQSGKAGEVTNLLRLCRTLRLITIFRIVKGLDTINRLLNRKNTFHKIIKLFENVLLCAPIFIKLALIMIMWAYIYAIIGMETFNSDLQLQDSSPYIDPPFYTDCNNLSNALLLMFQVITQSGWSAVMFDYAIRFGSLAKSSLFFNSFHAISTYVITSLLSGLIWEIFAYMEKFREEQDRLIKEVYEASQGHHSIAHSPYPNSFRSSYDLNDSRLSDVSQAKITVPRRAAKSLTEFDEVSFRRYSIPRQKRIDELMKPLDIPTSYLNKILQLQGQIQLDKDNQKSRKSIQQQADSIVQYPANFYKTKRKSSFSKIQVVRNSLRGSRLWEPVLNNMPEYRRLSVDVKKKFNIRELRPRIPLENDNDNRGNTKFSESDSRSHIYEQQNKLVPLKLGDSDEEVFERASPIQNESSSGTNSSMSREKNSKVLQDISLDIKFGESPKLVKRSIFGAEDEKRRIEAHKSKFNKQESLESFDKSLEEAGEAILSLPALDFEADDLEIKKSGSKESKESKGTSDETANWIVSNMQHSLSPQVDKNHSVHSDFNYYANTSEHIGFPVIDLEPKEGLPLAARGGQMLQIRINGESPLPFLGKQSSGISKKRYSHNMGIKEIQEIKKQAQLDKEVAASEEETDKETTLEKEFYTRKILVYEQVSIIKNQLDYVIDPSQKEKFSNDIILLNLEHLKEEADKEADRSMNDNMRSQNIEKKKMQLRSKLTVNQILRKALLKGTNKDAVQEYENQHLKNVYGKWFEYLQNPKIERVLDIFKTENNILIRFMRLLKQEDTECSDFVELTCMIEDSINVNILQKGSFGKFLFKDIQNKWFIIYKENKKFKIQYLKGGFWDYFDEVCADKSKLYASRDILFSGTKEKYEDTVQTFYISLKRIAKKITKNLFSEFQRNESVWNLYAIPFETSNQQHLRANLAKTIQADLKTNLHNIGKRLITQGVFISVNYIMKLDQSKVNDVKQVKPDFSSRKSFFKRRKRSFDSPKTGVASPKDDKHANSFTARMQYINNVNNSVELSQQEVEKKFFEENNDQKEKNPLSRVENTDEFLPLQEYIDFLKDIRDAINIHKDHLLNKLSQFYLGWELKNAKKK